MWFKAFVVFCAYRLSALFEHFGGDEFHLLFSLGDTNWIEILNFYSLLMLLTPMILWLWHKIPKALFVLFIPLSAIIYLKGYGIDVGPEHEIIKALLFGQKGYYVFSVFPYIGLYLFGFIGGYFFKVCLANGQLKKFFIGLIFINGVLAITFIALYYGDFSTHLINMKDNIYKHPPNFKYMIFALFVPTLIITFSYISDFFLKKKMGIVELIGRNSLFVFNVHFFLIFVVGKLYFGRLSSQSINTGMLCAALVVCVCVIGAFLWEKYYPARSKIKVFLANNRNGFSLMFICTLVFFLETCFFHMMLFVKDYLNANLVLVYVLFGLALGSFLRYFYSKGGLRTMALLVMGLIVSIYLAVVNIIWYPDSIPFSPFLWLPFTIAGFIIAQFFRLHNSGTMYFYDLLGAVCGIILSVTLIPLIRTENCVLFAGVLLSLWGVRVVSLSTMRTKSLILSTFILLLIITGYGFVYNLNYDSFNIAKVAKQNKMEKFGKIINDSKKYWIISSQDNLIQRVDVIYGRENKRSVAFDGFGSDSIYTKKTKVYKYDPRIVHSIFESTSPDVLVIGASAEGIIKPLRNETIAEKIDAIEINPAIIKIMKKPEQKFEVGLIKDVVPNYFQFSDRAYEGINIIRNDATTYLLHTNKKYDLITLMNTHPVIFVEYYGGPEYLHTKEAIRRYFDHLKPGGHVMIEERGNSDQAFYALYKIISTFYQTMKDVGIKSPENNILIYDYAYVKAKKNEEKLDIVPTTKYYTNVMFKNSPITERDKTFIDQWAQKIEKIHIQYFPGYDNNDSKMLKLIKDLKTGSRFFGSVDLAPITDNRPFPRDVSGQIGWVLKSFWNLIWGFVFLLAMIGYSVFRKREVKENTRETIIFAVYFSILGFAYLLIEVFMMQFYNGLMGGATYALIFIMGTLLFSSGIGAQSINKFGKRGVHILVSAIPIILLYHFFFNKMLLTAVASTPLVNSLWVSITVIPLGICMGAPFPFMLERSKQKLGSSIAPLFLALNLMFGALGVFFSIGFSLSAGFTATFLVGLGCYSVIILLMFMVEKKWKEQLL